MSERFIGGGKLFYEKSRNENDVIEWAEIGSIQKCVVSSKVETAKAMDYSNGYGEVADEVITSKEYSMSFETQDVSSTVLQMFLFGEIAVEINAQNKEVEVIKADKGAMFSGALKLESISPSTMIKNRTTIFHKVNLTPKGDLGLFGKEFVNIGFEGRLAKDKNGDIMTISKEK